MKLPTDWQCRHIFPLPIALGFTLMFLGLYFMDGWMTWVGIILIVSASIVFGCVLPEHNDPWKSQREAAESADEKPDGQAENARAMPPANENENGK